MILFLLRDSFLYLFSNLFYMARNPQVAGSFYEKDADKLNKQIEDCFYSKNGPGDLPLKRKNKDIKAVIVPHAGYIYSGPCAAWAYKEIAEAKMPELFIIIGPNHHSNISCISLEDWMTPFGAVKADRNFADILMKNSGIKVNEVYHAMEHSVEVQLPFLQYSTKDTETELRFLPILLSNDLDYKKFAKDLKKTIKQMKREVIFIISSDFTHYGSNYRYVPFSTDVEKRLKDLDKGAIDFIKRLDGEGFAEYLNKTGITICGFMPILLLLEMFNKEDTTVSLLLYYTSGSLSGDFRNSVSYVSILLK
jgi:MEMO1 family protein